MGSQIGASEANLTGQDANNPHNCVGGRYEATTGVTCGVHLHAVGENGVTYSESEGTAAGGGGVLTLSSKDVMLVSLGVALPVPTPLLAPDMSQGVHFSLVNNIWNTVSVVVVVNETSCRQNFFDLIIIIPFYIFLELSILVPVQQRYCVDERAVPLRDCARGVDLPLEISAF